MTEAPKRGRPKAMFSESTTIQALDRALDVLAFLSTHGGATLTEVAGGLDQSVATIHRVLGTLQSREFVEQAEGQMWHIGPAAFRTGSAFLRRTNVVERARPAMHALMSATGETSNLGVAWQGRVMFVSQVETHEMIRAFFPPGTLSAMHASGIGKALLAAGHPLPDAPLEQFTPRTLTDHDALAADLQATRERGYSIDDEERTLGMRCVAAPVLNLHGEAIAGVSVSGPTQRLTGERLAEIGALVRDAAAQIGHRMGAVPSGADQSA